MRDPFKVRLRYWFWQYLIAKDQMWGVRVSFFTYVLRGRGKVWDADETISSLVGRKAILGKLWALRLEKIIDWIFWKVIRQKDHCRNSIEILIRD